MKFDPQLHHRRSIRLKGYDYTRPEAYFVTLCAWRRDCMFGEVVGGEVRLSALGQIVRDEWLRSIEIRREIRLYEDEFVVMPNHFHGIVWIVESVGVDRIEIVGADGVRPNNTGVCHTPLRRVPRSLSSFIAGYKASVTHRAQQELNITGIWQRNYYDHIIRNEKELSNIWDYIETNPLKWLQDQLHPDVPPNPFNQDS